MTKLKGMLALAAVMAVLPASAKHQAHDLYVMPGIAGLYLDNNRTDLAKTRMLYNVAFGYNFTNALGVDVTPGYFRTYSQSTREYFRGYNISLNALYHFNTDGKLVPYVTGGVGVFNLDSVQVSNQTDFNGNVGVGFKIYFPHHWMIRSDLRRNMLFTSGRNHNDYIVNFGIGWNFSGANPNQTASFSDEPQIKLSQDDQNNDELQNDELELRFKVGQVEFDTENVDDSLNRVAHYLKRHPQSQLVLKGFADNSNPDENNLRLASHRAKFVNDELVEKFGVDESQLVYKAGDDLEVDDSLNYRCVLGHIEELKVAALNDEPSMIKSIVVS